MSIDKITDFKSVILDEVYRHQGFITAVSNTMDSYDENKKQQLSQLVSNQQRQINKSLGLIYSFFRTVNSFEALENEIKELVGDDLDKAFAVEDSQNFSNEVVSSGDLVATENENNVVMPQEEAISVSQDNPSVEGENTVVNDGASGALQNEVVSDGNLVAATENESGVVIPQEGAIGVSQHVTSSVEGEEAVVNDNTNVVPQNEVATSEFVLSPIDEGVAVAPTNEAVSGNVDVANVGDTSVVNPEVGITPVVEQAPVSVNVESEVGQGLVDTQVSQSTKRFIRVSQQPGKAILVTTSQMSKLSSSKESQKYLLVNANGVSQEINPTENSVEAEPLNVQQQVQTLMNQASQAYAAGKADEAQVLMDQVSELNKQIQGDGGNQASEGNAFVKK